MPEQALLGNNQSMHSVCGKAVQQGASAALRAVDAISWRRCAKRYGSTHMKYLTLTLSLLLSQAVIAGDLSEWLIENNPKGYFPATADYSSYSNVCNDNACFNLVAVYYVTPTEKGMRRLAVFSESDKYLGAYSGFNEMPIKHNGAQLIFPESELGNSINFSGKLPPAKVYIDGEYFEFEPKP